MSRLQSSLLPCAWVRLCNITESLLHNELVSIYVLYSNTIKNCYTRYLQYFHIHHRCNRCHKHLCHCLYCCCCCSHYDKQHLCCRALVEHNHSHSPSSIAYGMRAIVLLGLFLILVLCPCSPHHLFQYDGKNVLSRALNASHPCWECLYKLQW